MRKRKGKKADGAPCEVPPSWVGDSGYCISHDPARRDELRQAGQKGGRIGGRAAKPKKGLHPGELGPLETPEDARRWLEIAGSAVAEGRLTSRDGHVAVRACEAFLKAFDAGALQDEVKELRAKLRRALQKLLGHKSIKTTMVYASRHPDYEQVSEYQAKVAADLGRTHDPIYAPTPEEAREVDADEHA
jgi:hypothetical protein